MLNNWNAFFEAEVGAAATLAGLVFVAVSINLNRILEHPMLPLRALEALIALMSVVFVASIGLIPDQPSTAEGIEIVLVGALTWSFQTWALLSTYAEARKFARQRIRTLSCVLPAVPFIIGGVLLALGRPNGGAWIALGVLLSFVAALLNAWVLLIEIKR